MIDAPPVAVYEIEPLTGEEARRILDMAATNRNGARWSVALALGIRRDEALRLRWSYVDSETGVIRAWLQIQRVAGSTDATRMRAENSGTGSRVDRSAKSTATLLIAQGVHIRVVQEVLGHTRATPTERHTHVATLQMKDASERMDQALWGPG